MKNTDILKEIESQRDNWIENAKRPAQSEDYYKYAINKAKMLDKALSALVEANFSPTYRPESRFSAMIDGSQLT